MSPTPPTVILEGAVPHLSEVRDALALRGIHAELVRPPGARPNG